MKRILIVDDEEDFGYSVQTSLQATGDCHVEVANDGFRGLASARSRPPDLILLDLQMPGMSGLEVLKELKRDMRTITVPVLVLTAVVDEALKRRTANLYSQGYLEKPASIERLRERIQEVLDL